VGQQARRESSARAGSALRGPLSAHAERGRSEPGDLATGAREELAALRDGAIVVGHSVGGTILINVLADSRPKAALGALVLLATPFVGDGGWTSGDIPPGSDLASRLPLAVPVLLYHGENDDTVPVAHVELYARAIPRAQVRRLPGRDHQLNNDLSEVARDIRDMVR
jgi:pimeloyl-ACP methyl ester carboxylesterase